jgi:hydrogenase 3 maturation protease
VINPALTEQLEEFLSNSKRVAILGIGNDLRTDDGIGPFVVDNLQTNNDRVLIEDVGSVPEAFTSKISEFGADRVILIDAADMRKPVGHIELVTKNRIGGITISTHSMPLSLLMEYLEQQTEAKTILIGIQPQNLQFGEGMTPELEAVGKKLISMIDSILKTY